MASISLKNYFVSMEDMDEDGNPVVINIDSDTVEITQTFDEAEKASEDTEELQEAEEGLESIYASLEASLESGGLDPVAATFAHHAVQSYVNRLGMTSTDIMPGLESFGGSSRRLSATTVSMETIGETLQKIWAAIKAAVEKAILAVTNFFRKLFDGMGRLEKKFIALQTKLGELKDEKKSDSKEKMKVPSPNALKVKGSVKHEDIVSGFNNVLTNVKGVSEYITLIETYYEDLRKHVVKVGGDAGAVDTAVENLGSISTKISGESKSKFHSSEVMPGDKAFTYNASVKSKSLEENAVTFNLRIETVTGSKAFNDDSYQKMPTLENVTSLVGVCLAIIKAIGKRKDKVESVVKKRKAVVEEKIAGIKKDDKNFVGKAYDSTKARILMRYAQHDYIRPINQFDSYAFGALRAGYVYCSAIASNFKKAAAA